jgi:hypothetical protein
MGQGNSETVGENDLGVGEFHEHVSRGSGPSIPF